MEHFPKARDVGLQHRQLGKGAIADLLVAPLNAAVTLIQVDSAALAVRKDLNLDVSRPLDETLLWAAGAASVSVAGIRDALRRIAQGVSQHVLGSFISRCSSSRITRQAAEAMSTLHHCLSTGHSSQTSSNEAACSPAGPDRRRMTQRPPAEQR